MVALHEKYAFYRGDQWEIAGTLNDADGRPLNLAGASVQWIVEDAAGRVVLSYSLSLGIVVTDAAAGKILIVVPSAASDALPAGTYRDFCRATDAAGVPGMQAVGTIEQRESPFA